MKTKAFSTPSARRPKTQRAYAQTMLDQIHQQFIAVVKAGQA